MAWTFQQRRSVRNRFQAEVALMDFQRPSAKCKPFKVARRLSFGAVALGRNNPKRQRAKTLQHADVAPRGFAGEFECLDLLDQRAEQGFRLDAGKNLADA